MELVSIRGARRRRCDPRHTSWRLRTGVRLRVSRAVVAVARRHAQRRTAGAAACVHAHRQADRADRRAAPHPGDLRPDSRGRQTCLPRRRGRALLRAPRHRLLRRGARRAHRCHLRREDPGREHHHHAGGAQHVPHARQDRAPQAAGDFRHLSHGARVHEAGDLRPVPERHLLRPALLRRGGGGRGLLRQDARQARRRRGGHHRRRAQGAVALQSHRRCAGRHAAPRLRAAAHARARLHRRRDRRGRQQGADAGTRARAAV